MTHYTFKTRTMQRFLQKEINRVTGVSVEPDGVFIYTNPEDWCDDAGSGTFRGNSEVDAIKRFYDRVQPGRRARIDAQWDAITDARRLKMTDRDAQAIQDFMA